MVLEAGCRTLDDILEEAARSRKRTRTIAEKARRRATKGEFYICGDDDER